MTVSTELNLIFHDGDNVAVTFPFTFPVYNEDHLYVYLKNETTGVLTLVSAADYAVSGVNDENGGSVTLDTAPTTAQKILIARILPYTQDLDILNQGGFYPESMEREFDIEEMQIQQIKEVLGRTVRAPLGETLPELPPAEQRGDTILVFDSDGNPTTDITIVTNILVNYLSDILVAGYGISLTIGDGTITITNTLPGGGNEQEAWLLENAIGGSTPDDTTNSEFIRDTIGAALQGLGCVVTVDDPGNTITIDFTQDTSAEVIRDVMGATLVAGTDISITVDDPSNTITIASLGGVGGFQPLDDTLTGIAAENPTTNEVLYATGLNTFDVMTVTPVARTLLDDTTTAAMLATLGAVAAGTGTFGANTVSVTIPLTSGQGSVLLQGGKSTIAGDSGGTITFPTPYSVAPVAIVSGGAGTAGEGDVHITAGASTTGVTIYNSRGGTVTYMWFAIGKA